MHFCGRTGSQSVTRSVLRGLRGIDDLADLSDVFRPRAAATAKDLLPRSRSHLTLRAPRTPAVGKVLAGMGSAAAWIASPSHRGIELPIAIAQSTGIDRQEGVRITAPTCSPGRCPSSSDAAASILSGEQQLHRNPSTASGPAYAPPRKSSRRCAAGRNCHHPVSTTTHTGRPGLQCRGRSRHASRPADMVSQMNTSTQRAMDLGLFAIQRQQPLVAVDHVGTVAARQRRQAACYGYIRPS